MTTYDLQYEPHDPEALTVRYPSISARTLLADMIAMGATANEITRLGFRINRMRPAQVRRLGFKAFDGVVYVSCPVE